MLTSISLKASEGGNNGFDHLKVISGTKVSIEE